jgi:hypothetical protein
MKKLIPLLIAGLLSMPASAQASSLSIWGRCVVADDGHVSLVGRARSYEYSGYAPYEWVYRYRSIGEARWQEGDDLGFRTWVNVIPKGNFDIGFRSVPVETAGMVYRLDLIYGIGNNRVNRVAFYDDSTTTRRDCRHPA